MLISLIAALDKNRLIGAHQQLPWHLPADLKYFKQMTLGKPIVMGRKTFQSIGRPLPGRENIIITSQTNFQAPGATLLSSVSDAINHCSNCPEMMVIGGARLFEQMLPLAKRLYLTLIHATFQGDTFFPPWDPQQWQALTRQDHLADDTNPYAYSFVILERQELTP